MEFGKKVVIAVDLHETSREQLSQLRQIRFLKNAEVHFVHVFQTTIMTYGLGEFCQIYPVEPDRREIETSVISTMKKLTDGFLDPGVKIVYKCLFDENPKQEFGLYTKSIHADTVIVFTRAKHGFFESSFAQYLVRHTQCNTVILKP